MARDESLEEEKSVARRVFYSFHYKADAWRASQVRNIGAVEGNEPAKDNDWETVTRGGDAAIQRWIDGQLKGRSCTVVLVGEETAGRKWIDYEIRTSWSERKGLLGVYIHNLKDRSGEQSAQGVNPFDKFSLNVGGSTQRLSRLVSCYEPPYSDSVSVYAYIKKNIGQWIEDAVAIRSRY
jgi:hypothetical protein